MSFDSRKDPDWKIKVNIAKTVAEQSQPSLMKLYQAYSEEFGTQPPEELVKYFNSMIESEPVQQTNSGNDIEAFIAEATAESLSILKFRQAYENRFREKPSVECIERYIEGLGTPDSSIAMGPVNLAHVVIDQLSADKKMTVLEFRKAFKEKLGKQPSADHVQLFIDRLSAESSESNQPAAVTESKTKVAGKRQGEVGKFKPYAVKDFLTDPSIFDGITRSGVVFTDVNGNIVECNRVAEEILAVSRAELIGKSNILSFLDGRDLEVYCSQLSLEIHSDKDGFDAFVAKVDTAKPFTREWRCFSKQRANFSAEITVSRFPDEGSQQGYLLEICDRTEHNEMRRQIQTLLEKRQAQRIERENLIAAIGRKVLDPVTSIKGFSELLSEKSNEKLKRYFDLISGSADAIVHIIGDYLISHNVTEGDFELEISPFSLQALATDAVRYHSRWLGAKDVIIELVENDKLPPYFLGDGVAIRHVLTAILSHAIELPGDHHIQVRPNYKELEGGKIQIYFDVVSRGSEVSPDFLDEVFSSAENLTADESLSHVLTELGLGICRQLARMMSGDIEVKIATENTVCYRFTATVSQEAELTAKATQPIRILVGENDPAVYRLLNKILTDEGCQVTWAKSGQQVVDLYLNAPSEYDLIYMDIGMPEKNGMLATKEIRSAGHSTIPIIALTACNVPGDSERFQLSGMSGYVIKPFTKPILLNSLKKWQTTSTATQTV